MKIVYLWIVFFMFASAATATATASPSATVAPDDAVRQLWQLLDYVSVDYGGAVSDGAVAKASEYAEMREFSETALRGMRELPETVGKPALAADAQALVAAIERKASALEVAEIAHRLADSLLLAYPIAVAPSVVPDVKRGAALFAENCVACHGPRGNGDGPLASRLDPPPIAFTDSDRAKVRSLLALYQAVSQGVSGTSMPAFKALSESDRWAVTFFVSGLSYSDEARKAGARRWPADPALRSRVSDLSTLTRTTEESLASDLGATEARDVMAYLRATPSAVTPSKTTGLALSRSRLNESLVAYRARDLSAATRLALSAYLDGFEPLEPSLSVRNKPLLVEVETAMLAYRAAIVSADDAEVAGQARDIGALLDRVESELEPAKADATTAFAGALTILLREGIEALLVVVGMIAFLRKAQRPDVIRHVHVGWLGALTAGGVTWFVATYLVGVSGASRELTEGASSVFAAVVLLGVGLWMHQKSTAGRWQEYLKAKMTHAMTRRSAYALAALAFIAVYREVFESVLFFSALWADGNGSALLAGLGTGVVILAAIAWALLRTSARMPIAKFFSVSSVIVAVLAIVLAGKGVKALQEAGVLAAHAVAFPRVEFLGLFPTDETLIAQAVVALVALLGFWLNLRRPSAVATA